MDTESSRENISWSKWMVEHKHTVCIEWMIMNDLTKTHGLYSSHIALFVDQVPKSLVLLLRFLYFICIWPLRHHSSQHAIFCLQPALQTTFPIMSNRCNIKDCKIDTTCKFTYIYLSIVYVANIKYMWLYLNGIHWPCTNYIHVRTIQIHVLNCT